MRGRRVKMERYEHSHTYTHIHTFAHTHTRLPPTLQGTKEDHEAGMKGAKGRLDVGVECAF